MQFFLGLMENQSIILGLVLFLLLVVISWNILLHTRISKLLKKNSELFEGNKTKNLEEVILDHARAIKSMDKDIHELFEISNKIHALAYKGLHKTGVIRFNPFSDVGGDQSFSIALLNGKNNGLVISSLYTREGTRVFTKSIIDGKSEKHPLTEEEEKTIQIALSSGTKKI